jgi:hypothetical protein
MFEDRRHLVFAPAAMALSSLMAWLQVYPTTFQNSQERDQAAEVNPASQRQSATADA